MQRRKFLAGVGSLAAGSAAAMGTGAFSSARAERTINVATSGDASAYLGLDASTSVYAEQTGETLELQFDEDNGEGGKGLNANADTTFANVFKIKNNGTNTIRVQLGSDDAAKGAIGYLPDGPMAVLFTSSPENNSVYQNATPFAASPDFGANSGAKTNQDLAPGESFYVHFSFCLNSDIQTLGSEASTDVDDVPDDIGFYAGTTPDKDGL